MVFITVNNLNTSKYEGTFSATFRHSIITEDEGSQSAFLRPVSMTLQDDSTCVSGSEQFEQTYADKTRVRKCGCQEGFYIHAVDTLFCDSATECLPCPTGMACGFQQNIATANIAKGFYRTHNDTTKVVRCPGLSWQCIGNATHGDSLCSTGHEGPFCMLCKLNDEARYVRSGEKCLPCDSKQESTMMLAFAVCVLLLCGIAAYIFYRSAAESSEEENKVRNQKFFLFDSDIPSRWESFVIKSMVKYKIVVTFAQILNKLMTLYPMSLPPTFTEYHAKTNFLGFIDIDIIPFNCLLDVTFHDKLMGMTIAPIVFVGLVGMLYVAQRTRLLWQADEVDTKKERVRLQAKCVFVVLTFLYTAFPILSALVIQTFVYDERLEDGRAFLKADYSFQREDSSQQDMQVYAIMIGLLYCIGIPVCSYALLRWKKKPIQNLQALEFRIIHARKGSPQVSDDTGADRLMTLKRHDTEESLIKLKSDMIEQEPMLDGLSLLFKDYEPQYWWWETVRFMCTFFLCGLVTLTNLSDGSQVFVALVFSTAMLMAYANCNPYLHKADDVLAQSCQVTLSLALAVGLLDMSGDDFMNVSFGAMLVVCLAAILGTGGGIICFEFLAVFFPKEMARVMAALSRGLRRLKCQPDQPSSQAVAPLLDTSGATALPICGSGGSQAQGAGISLGGPMASRPSVIAGFLEPVSTAQTSRNEDDDYSTISISHQSSPKISTLFSQQSTPTNLTNSRLAENTMDPIERLTAYDIRRDESSSSNHASAPACEKPVALRAAEEIRVANGRKSAPTFLGALLGTAGSSTTGSVSKAVPRKFGSSARKVSLTSQMTMDNLAV